jgi:hypothetical protein
MHPRAHVAWLLVGVAQRTTYVAIVSMRKVLHKLNRTKSTQMGSLQMEARSVSTRTYFAVFEVLEV